MRTLDLQTGKEGVLATQGVFIYIGHKPNTALFQGQLDMDPLGYLVTDKWLHTNVQGVFAAGEVTDPHFRQVITSAGMGAAAAMEAGKIPGRARGRIFSGPAACLTPRTRSQ